MGGSAHFAITKQCTPALGLRVPVRHVRGSGEVIVDVTLYLDQIRRNMQAPSTPSIYDLRFTEVREIDCGRDTHDVNKLLGEGWVLIRVRTETSLRDGHPIEWPLYILGLPSE